MKWLVCVALCVASLGFAGLAGAADSPSPAGTWKFSIQFGERMFEQTVKLMYEDGKLSGYVPGRNNVVTPIENATYKDGEIAFTVTRERNGVKTTSKYTGKVTSDSITGKIEFERDGKPQTRDWLAKKVPE